MSDQDEFDDPLAVMMKVAMGEISPLDVKVPRRRRKNRDTSGENRGDGDTPHNNRGASPPKLSLVEVLEACGDDELPASVSWATAPDGGNSARTAQDSARMLTSLGTPRAKSWDDAWFAAVESAEGRLGRRICGARLTDGTPCEMRSDHGSGRCRFHGGFDLTGAPKRNRNAYMHGLYSRRLKTCGPHCPQWDSCPVAQGQGCEEVESAPEPKRPVCPFEQGEYNMALADALDLMAGQIKTHPFGMHIAHNIAILQVMLGRAAVEMRNAATASVTLAESDKYAFRHEQVRPHLAAISRIGAELRKWMAFLSKGGPYDMDWRYFESRQRWIRSTSPGPEPEQFDYVPPDPNVAANERARENYDNARKAITLAVLAAREGNPAEAERQHARAKRYDAKFTAKWTRQARKTAKGKCEETACGETACEETACEETACEETACGETACGETACEETACEETACGETACGETACGETACEETACEGTACEGTACGEGRGEGGLGGG